MDKERIEGFRKAFEPGETYRWEIPKTERERMCFYEDNYMQLPENSVTAVFAVSDFYALEFMRFLQGKNFGFQRISRSSALMITWQAGKVILPSQRFIRKQT